MKLIAEAKPEELQKTHPHLSRERVLKMYSREGGRIHTKEGILRALAPENAEHPGAIK